MSFQISKTKQQEQFTGLMDCQARSEKVLLKSFNASFAALNLHSGMTGKGLPTENRFQLVVGKLAIQ